MLNREFPVPTQVYLDAKHYVERKHIPFFDFFRHCIFGFVSRKKGKGGWFVHVIREDDGTLTSYCGCGEADSDEICGHAMALYLKLIDWPFERTDLSDDFDRFPLVGFFRKLAPKISAKVMHPDSNPALSIPDGVGDQRMMRYWGFARGEEILADRDRKALTRAKKLCRTAQEIALLKKGFPSAAVKFEESALYAICKLFFELDRAGELTVRVENAADHRVLLAVRTGEHQIFHWTMPIETFLKGYGVDKRYWRPRCGFEIRDQSIPISYRIGFTGDNQLEVEPRISVAEGLHIGLDEALLPGSRGLYFHEQLGYFHVQTGLSPFEMEYAEPGVEIVPHERVKKFLSTHRATLHTLDRSLIDDSVFGEVVAERFDRLILELLTFEVGGWFRFSLEAQMGEHSFDNAGLRAVFAEGGRYHKLAGKLFDADGYDGVYLKPLYEGEREDALHVTDLFRMLAFFKGRVQVDTNDLTGEVFVALSEFKGPEAPSLEGTRLNLRDYQKIGYAWLYFLRSFGLGGLLCDQMGLGKTHQGMALLASILGERPEGRVLVVAPTSVIYHWKDKLQTFCPGITAAIYHGTDRDLEGNLRRFQVMISTYGTLRNDAELFDGKTFDLILFDEIQKLKNKQTKAYKSLSKLRGRCKIGLTGTPIENHIRELKSLMDLVFPGYLGSDRHFNRYYVDPIVKLDSQPAKDAVRAMIKPFIMRRNKSEVLLELPAKTEDLRTYHLSSYERELYHEGKETGKEGLKLDSSNRMHIWSLIGKLKQLCDHPALFFGNTDYNAYPSTKWEMFKELLDEAMDSGEKVVVFTQYLGMVEMFAHYLASLEIDHAVITGATRDRQEQQRRFQEDEGCKVFIGSIMAAGVGIDLTAASIAIHYDRWWNPAVEEQATDRIHRIGQKKNVQVFKFRGIGTVEERIDEIISRKAGLLEDVVDFDSEAIGKTLTMDELLEILK